MSPEDAATRLVRVEEQGKGHDRDLKILMPLVGQYMVLEERYQNLRDDLNNGLDAMRDEIKAIKRDQDERAKERRTMLLALFIAGIGLFGTFAAQLLQLRGGR